MTETGQNNDLDSVKKQLLNDNRYNDIYNKAEVILRDLRLNSSIPGYELMKLTCCIKIILDFEDENDIYDLLGRISIIPSPNVPKMVIKDVRPEEQWMTEAIRAAGIQEDVLTFISQICDIISKS